MTSDKRTFHVHPNLETSEAPAVEDPAPTHIGESVESLLAHTFTPDELEPFVYVNTRPDQDLSPWDTSPFPGEEE